MPRPKCPHSVTNATPIGEVCARCGEVVKRARATKCAYCGRENVAITKKGYMRPHVKTDGRPCLKCTSCTTRGRDSHGGVFLDSWYPSTESLARPRRGRADSHEGSIVAGPLRLKERGAYLLYQATWVASSGRVENTSSVLSSPSLDQ